MGRDGELARLSALWDETWRGKGRRLVLSGEAGIGKSRLLRALRESLAEVSWSIRELHCREEWREMPLKATTALIERLLAFGPDDTPQERRDLLRAYLSVYHAPFCDRAYPPIEALLGIGADSPAPSGWSSRPSMPKP
ncbi:MAG: AAA family ATPase [Rhodocyclaceae bacterium]|nr:AAA family ATPase [Rhodocyclaceae bacterium]